MWLGPGGHSRSVAAGPPSVVLVGAGTVLLAGPTSLVICHSLTFSSLPLAQLFQQILPDCPHCIPSQKTLPVRGRAQPVSYYSGRTLWREKVSRHFKLFRGKQCLKLHLTNYFVVHGHNLMGAVNVKCAQM